ncbi:MAG: site-specific DNA-methyltransferase [Bacteroidales bacterium]|nr:site-specific DNA-methyltransferase [Bacteroidales bacterium]
MNSKYKKLELCWPGKDIEVKPEPRVLIEDPEKSYGKADTENMLIHADNLLALKALEQNFSGRIKCIYIDPPYNTGNAFEHYDDGLEHSIWLNLMYSRINILYKLLANEGVIFINVDEVEHAYLKVMLDGIFGRNNFIGDIIWKKRKGGGNDSRFIALDHDYIIVYAKNATKETHKIKWRVSQSEEYLKRYKEIDENGERYYWDTLARDGLQNPIPVTIDCPDGSKLAINSQKSIDTINEGLKNGQIRLTKSRNGWTLHHRVYMPSGQVLRSILDDVGTNKTANDETIALFGVNNAFDYPKPESLIKKLLELVTKKGDWVLDSFLGSGTTAAVAHKMKRNYIGIELGQHCNTHCLPRLKSVCDGSDQGGVSKALDWKGGGGFKFYNLAPSLLNKDKYNQWVINPNYNADLLAAAMARHEGFSYSPDESVVWKQGFATENHFIFTTTNTITPDVVEQILSEMKPDESLRICCTAFIDGCNEISNRIEIKKIPEVLLGKCEFGKEDYCTDTNIINMPADPDKPAFTPSYVKPDVKPEPANIKKDTPTQTKLLF